MKRNHRYLSLLFLGLFPWTCALAQPANRPSSPNDTLQSVVVGPDNRVTFSIYAPKATTVTVGGDFLMGAPAPTFTKADNGVWSFTTNPLPPDSYTYNFNVDGVGVLDTKSSNFRENPNSLFNFFDMPGPETDFMALKNVPHGRVESVLYHSSTLNAERRMHVYLPPNFESLPETLQHKLPVLYLLHGFGDNDISWTSAGKINLILDNLYAEGKLKNMIVVMPAGHVPGPSRGPMSFSGTGPDNDPFCQDFLKDLVPYVEKTYPLSTKREDTAIAGFSMGGAQALTLALWHLEKFAYLFPVSTGFFGNGIQLMQDQNSAVLKNAAAHPFKLTVFGCGKQDSMMQVNIHATMKLFDQYKIPYQYQELNGAHSFVFSRRFLASVFPLMFR